MVVIEPAPTEEENDRIDANPKSKPEAKPSETTAVAAESSHGAESAAGYASDGFETASDSELKAGDDDKDDDQQHQHRHQPEERQPQSVAPEYDSLQDSSGDEESRQKALSEANDAKLEGNRLFADRKYEEALSQYDHALQVAPDVPSSVEIRSICHANRAICFLKLEKYQDTIKECTKALELNPSYLKALLRRGEAYEKLEHFEEAIADMKKILELDPSDVQARRTIQRLEPLAAEKREKMKQEMIDKLKEMGNSILGRFGMSTDNFKAVQDPKTGSYSISFQR
ncbi:hypothetical protein NMG60_11013935 [Bertholletia excelsa]